MLPEDALVLWASKRVGRPVKWVGTRSKGMQTDTQGRGQEIDLGIAATRVGRLLGIRAEA